MSVIRKVEMVQIICVTLTTGEREYFWPDGVPLSQPRPASDASRLERISEPDAGGLMNVSDTLDKLAAVDASFAMNARNGLGLNGA